MAYCCQILDAESVNVFLIHIIGHPIGKWCRKLGMSPYSYIKAKKLIRKAKKTFPNKR